MRITSLLILITALHVSARTVAQKVTLSSDNITIAQLFQKLNKQTGYSFLLKDAIIPANQKVSVHVKDASLEEVLNKTLQPLSLSFEIDNRIVFIIKSQKPAAAAVMAPPPLPAGIDVRGRVIDTSGAPLIGATIVVKGKQRGTLSGLKGEFELKEVPDGARLVISYAGDGSMEVTINDATKLPLIILVRPSHNELDEAIVQA